MRRRRMGTTTRLVVLHRLAVAVVMGVVLVQVVRGFSAHYRHTLVSDLAEEAPEYQRAASLRPAGEDLGASPEAGSPRAFWPGATWSSWV
jgi:hypothetical protein